MSTTTIQTEVTLLRVGEVLRRVGLSRPTVYRQMQLGKFPAAVYPTPRAPRWRSDEIDKFVERLTAERPA